MPTVRITGGVLETELVSDAHPAHPIELPPYLPAHPIELPDPPPGLWPPPTVAHPIVPAPEPTPPGMIWPMVPRHPIVIPPTPPAGGTPSPNPPTPGHPLPQKFWTLALIPGYGWYYICVDPAQAFEVEPPTVQPVGRRG